MSENRIQLVKVEQPQEADEMKSFMLVVRRALLMVVDYIDRRYRIGNKRH